MSINLFIYGDRYILIDLTYVTHLAYFSYSHIVLVEAFYKRQSDFMTLLSFSKRTKMVTCEAFHYSKLLLVFIDITEVTLLKINEKL